MTVIIDHTRQLTLTHVMSAANGSRVELARDTRQMLTERREQIVRHVREQEIPAYGFNRGFGHNVDLSVPDEHLCDLQRNLILSHAVGVGEPMDRTVVRMTMLLRANSLARGFSGVRPELVQGLLDLLNAGITPVVPELGSVGASGDLAPLSHIAMALMGEGEVFFGQERMPAKAALEKTNLRPLRFEMKEGLALNNGVQFMNALGLAACAKLKDLLRTAAVNSALVAQVMLAPDTYFRPDFHALRPHAGARRVADWIWRLMKNSPIRAAHRDFKTDGQVQDPYNIRCAAQVLGTCHDLIATAEKALLTEANSATDNPILLPDAHGKFTDIVSGGHFHGMPVAVQIYNLMQALSIMANLAHMRSVRFVDPVRNKGLGRDLKWPDMAGEDQALSSGMMMLEYASASLTNDIWGQCMPSHLFNISTNSGQEDHVSMGTGLAVRLLKTLPRTAHVLAIELAYIRQAIAVRKRLGTIPTEATPPDWVNEELNTLKDRMNGHGNGMVFNAEVSREHPLSDHEKQFSPASEALLAALDEHGLFPVVRTDRYLADDVARLASFVESGRVPDVVSPLVPLPWEDME
ncbi:HAL/PAL/TAL family ammonia-lyase [Pseudodesulfovibrio senegalensis]|uniref:Aromatic amino acid lyase n=1 Tax=Pseudodesulfovibrio senegalensis TaxID=1721087 RepID=A0A6N6N3F4_9BACT|nr:aromatic amino acid ammonia-lyase [Pseudodesulfovibrio senegalensis]KAB1442365.1 aromatic amino acid lyase [Pseudodesulfovibrio senegalensis]